MRRRVVALSTMSPAPRGGPAYLLHAMQEPGDGDPPCSPSTHCPRSRYAHCFMSPKRQAQLLAKVASIPVG